MAERSIAPKRTLDVKDVPQKACPTMVWPPAFGLSLLDRRTARSGSRRVLLLRQMILDTLFDVPRRPLGPEKMPLLDQVLDG